MRKAIQSLFNFIRPSRDNTELVRCRFYQNQNREWFFDKSNDKHTRGYSYLTEWTSRSVLDSMKSDSRNDVTIEISTIRFEGSEEFIVFNDYCLIEKIFCRKVLD